MPNDIGNNIETRLVRSNDGLIYYQCLLLWLIVLTWLQDRVYC